MMKSVPIRTKPWLRTDEAASQIEIVGGTMFGQILIANPVYPKNIIANEIRNGPACGVSLFSERTIMNTLNPTNTGTGANHRICGKLNQRLATFGWVNGVQMLTAMIAAVTKVTDRRATWTIRFCSAPSVFIMSQVQPNSV